MTNKIFTILIMIITISAILATYTAMAMTTTSSVESNPCNSCMSVCKQVCK